MYQPMKLSPITPMRKRIYEYIIVFKSEHDGNSPTIRQLAKKFDRSESVIHYDLSCLAKLGLIERGGKGESRMIKVKGGQWLAPFKTMPSDLNEAKAVLLEKA